MTKLFPTILIVLDVCAAVPYALKGDFRHTIHWLAAANSDGLRHLLI